MGYTYMVLPLTPGNKYHVTYAVPTSDSGLQIHEVIDFKDPRNQLVGNFEVIRLLMNKQIHDVTLSGQFDIEPLITNNSYIVQVQIIHNGVPNPRFEYESRDGKNLVIKLNYDNHGNGRLTFTKVN